MNRGIRSITPTLNTQLIECLVIIVKKIKQNIGGNIVKRWFYETSIKILRLISKDSSSLLLISRQNSNVDFVKLILQYSIIGKKNYNLYPNSFLFYVITILNNSKEKISLIYLTRAMHRGCFSKLVLSSLTIIANGLFIILREIYNEHLKNQFSFRYFI